MSSSIGSARFRRLPTEALRRRIGALLNLLDRFWNAINPVNSTIASSVKKSRSRATIGLLTLRFESVIASAYSSSGCHEQRPRKAVR
jgi:hypothetical protein